MINLEDPKPFPLQEWFIESRKITAEIAIKLLDNLFKIHSLGIGGLLAFMAATPTYPTSCCCAKILISLVFLCLITGLGMTIWAFKKTYEGQDRFTDDGQSAIGKNLHEEAKRWALISFILFIIGAALFLLFLIVRGI